MSAAQLQARALSGIRVIEACNGIGGGYAGKLLFDLGAEVIKVESPSGDPLRRYRASPGASEGALFDYLNAGKRGLCLDLQQDSDREILARAIVSAHIVLAEEADDADRTTIAAVADLVPETSLPGGRALIAVSDFGGHGPYAGRPTTDLTLQALAGWVSPRGRTDTAPVQVGLRAHQYVVGVQVACAALTALRSSRILGERVTASVSRLESVFTTARAAGLPASLDGLYPRPAPLCRRMGCGQLPHRAALAGHVRCARRHGIRRRLCRNAL
jgi:crotonobetainyl-CoA:carnitine CoA-transferase CaiB-like acyl-CoA transferase